MAIEYEKAGVSVEAGYESVRLMKQYVARTMNDRVVTDLGGFGGLFSLAGTQMEDPILVSGTDGVGTKVKLAFLMDRHDTVGIDCVAMCVNDVICCGASPLFFLDYIACGKNDPAKIASIVSGVAEGCVQSHSALIGGETAEHPGLMPVDEYDLAGFSVGIVDRKDVIDGRNVRPGDMIIGIGSTGIHSNGFSLVRKVFGLDQEDAKERLSVYYDALGRTLGETLLTPTRIYVKAIESLKGHVSVKAISHITGGGFYENIPRMLPAYTRAVIQRGSWEILPVFDLIQKTGEISDYGMFNTFNMGIGMMLVVDPAEACETLKLLEASGEHAYSLGVIETCQSVDPEVELI